MNILYYDVYADGRFSVTALISSILFSLDIIWPFTGPGQLEVKAKDKTKCPYLASQETSDNITKQDEGRICS